MATKRPPSILRILRFIAFAVALLGSGKLVSTVLFYNDAYVADGIILDFAPNDEFLAPETTPIIAYIDFRSQKLFTTPQSALGTEDVFLGQKLRIRYDPNAPDIFFIDTPVGLWGSGVVRILLGLIPYIMLSFFIGASGTGPPARQAGTAPARSQTIKPLHLIRHKSAPPSETGVVRRMR